MQIAAGVFPPIKDYSANLKGLVAEMLAVREGKQHVYMHEPSLISPGAMCSAGGLAARQPAAAQCEGSVHLHTHASHMGNKSLRRPMATDLILVQVSPNLRPSVNSILQKPFMQQHLRDYLARLG